MSDCFYDPSISHHSPEVLSPGFEVGDSNELEDLLRGMDELASASGGYSGTQYAKETLDAMRRQGIDVNPFTVSTVLKRSFGDPEELLSRMDGHTAEELDEMLPGEIGDAAVDYLKPAFGQE